ncbi:unnamed protein product [Merluccius merluccius]
MSSSIAAKTKPLSPAVRHGVMIVTSTNATGTPRPAAATSTRPWRPGMLGGLSLQQPLKESNNMGKRLALRLRCSAGCNWLRGRLGMALQNVHSLAGLKAASWVEGLTLLEALLPVVFIQPHLNISGSPLFQRLAAED